MCELDELKKANQALQVKNKILSEKLIKRQEEYQGQAIFLDALENLLLDHGFKVVSIHE